MASSSSVWLPARAAAPEAIADAVSRNADARIQASNRIARPLRPASARSLEVGGLRQATFARIMLCASAPDPIPFPGAPLGTGLLAERTPQAPAACSATGRRLKGPVSLHILLFRPPVYPKPPATAGRQPCAAGREPACG